MATRKHLWHPDEVRQKIQASQLINRLTTHALSDTPIMDASQVKAAQILLGKAIPDLTSSDHRHSMAGQSVAELTSDELRAILAEGNSGGTAEADRRADGHNSVH